MCFPHAIPIAITLAGAGAQFIGQKRADKAREAAFAAEQLRQHSFDKEQNAHFDDSLDRARKLVDPQATQDAAAERNARYQAALQSAGDAGSYLPGSDSAPQIVADTAASAGAASDAGAAGLGTALANLGGFDDALQETNIGLGRDAGAISQLAGFRRGSLEASQAELRAAAEKGKTLRTLGSLAQTIGQTWLAGSLGGGPAPVNPSDVGATVGRSIAQNHINPSWLLAL